MKIILKKKEKNIKTLLKQSHYQTEPYKGSICEWIGDDLGLQKLLARW